MLNKRGIDMQRLMEAVVIACLAACTVPAKDTTKPVKVYILAGQSNAEGRGSPDFLKENFPELAKPREDLWHFRPVTKMPGPFMGPNYGAYGLEFKAGHVLGEAVDNDLTSLKQGLVGYWKFDEPAGGEVASAVEGGAKGQGGAARVDGKFGKAVKLTSKQKIEFVDYKDPVNAQGQLDNMSIAFWVKTPVGEGDHRIGKGAGSKSQIINDANWFISQNANRQGWDIYGYDWAGLAGFTAVVNKDGSNEVFAATASGGFAGDGTSPANNILSRFLSTFGSRMGIADNKALV